ncbi:hypothetical protein [Kitasatospora sp. NPDC092286]|uniref:hypothetical protein n=1 Tax=Kitasatospora sp. NPDC092286 TaxID=3364087 RepID=UPI0037F8BBA0
MAAEGVKNWTADVSVAHDCEDIHHLVDRMTPAQVRRLMPLVTQDEELAPVAEGLTAEDETREAEAGHSDRLLSLAGIIDGPADLAERLGVDRVATLDRRHFTVVKPAHCAVLTLLP